MTGKILRHYVKISIISRKELFCSNVNSPFFIQNKCREFHTLLNACQSLAMKLFVKQQEQ